MKYLKKTIAGMTTVCALITGVVCHFPNNIDNFTRVNAVDFSELHTITLEDVKAIQAFCLTSDYVGPGNVIDLNNDGSVDVFDLTLAKRELADTGVPSLVDFSANVCDIYINSDENVVFTLDVTEVSPLEDNAISIYDDNDDFVAFMHDDGNDGDETADDGIYTATVSLSSDEIKTVNYYAATDEVKSNCYEICFYRDLEEEEFENFWILYSNISELSFDEACEYVKQSDEIKTYSINEQDKVIDYQSIYGIYGYWEEIEESSGMTKGSGTYAVPEANGIDYDAVKNAVSSSDITPAHTDKKDVIVLRPFRHSEFPYDDFQTVGNLLSEALDSNVTVVDDENVTLEQMKNLASYGTVLIDSHGTLKNNSTPYMLIGENLDEMKFLWDIGYYLQHVEYSADYLSGRIYCTSFRRGQQVFHRMAVGGKFFEKYYSDNSLTDSFWFLGTCYSMHDNSIADALIGKGAEAVAGFTNKVSIGYCNSTLYETVLNSMVLSAENVSRSVIEAKRIYGQVDPSGPTTTIRMRGKTNFKLVSSINSNEYWVIFHEGFRNGRLEMSKVTAPKDAKITWNKSLTLNKQNGNCDQYYFDGKNWIKTRTYGILTDYAIDIVASNADIYDENGNVVFQKNDGINGHYYGTYSDQETWEDAEKYCESLGGHLATISSEDENMFIFDMLSRRGIANAYFGFNDSETEGEWKWVNNEVNNYTNWASSEPSNDYEIENYAMFYYKFTNGEWNDGDFGVHTENDETNFICEWEIPKN